MLNDPDWPLDGPDVHSHFGGKSANEEDKAVDVPGSGIRVAANLFIYLAYRQGLITMVDLRGLSGLSMRHPEASNADHNKRLVKVRSR